MVFDKSQLLRGTLEGCILMIISRRMTYGYEIQQTLKKFHFSDVSEGTIYPLLLRLEKQGSIKARLMPSPLGPKRKYFEITKEGIDYLASFRECWAQLSVSVTDILEEKGGGVIDKRA